MPVLNAASTVDAQLRALGGQDYASDWEVVIADNGSTDGSREVVRGRLSALPRARLITRSGSCANERSRARNAAAAVARGDLLAFCDADDLVMPGWLTAIVNAARHGDIVAGRLDVETLNPPAIRSWHETSAWERVRPIHRFLPHASTSNCAVWADVLDALGGFDEGKPGAEDRDFAWRAQLAGHRFRFAPDAVVAYRYRSSAGATAQQHYEWGKANARLFRDFGSAGMRRTSAADALRAWAWSAYSLPTLLWSPPRRGRWMLRTAHRWGHVVGSVRQRVVFL